MSRIIFPANQRIFKNRIINGDFSVWQRGTTATYISDSVNLTVDGGYKTADRIFCANARAGGQFTVSKSTMNGFNSFRVTVDTPPDNLTWDGTNIRWWLPFRYRFEGQHLYDLVIKKSSITISFWFRSNVNGLYTVSLLNLTSNVFTDGSVDTFITGFDYTGSGNPQKIVITIPLDYTWATQPLNDNNLGFMFQIGAIGDALKATTTDQWTNELSVSGETVRIHPNYTNWASTAGNYIEIAQLQLEEGETATDFEYVPYDIQLMRCMRYYEKSYNIETPPGTVTNIGAILWDDPVIAPGFQGDINFRVYKRAIPTVTTYSPVTGAKGVTRDVLGGVDVTVSSINYVSPSRFCEILHSANFSYDQISFHYTVDAEL